jgi:pimeloyl-ACP methyl ester carboxylesterase
LAKIKVPTLVMVGEEDVISPPAEAREMASLLPTARLEVIPQAGHLTPYENPQAANAAILRFLDHF